MNRNYTLIRAVFAVGALALAGWVLPTAVGAKPYYQGKTITLLVGFPPAGGIDLVARLNAKHLVRHIAGNPKMIVRNMPGARGLKAGNFIISKAKKDGLTIYYQPWFWAGEVVGSPGQRFKWADFTLISAFQNPGQLPYIRTDAVPGGIKKATDIMKAKSLKYGGSGPTSGRDMAVRLSLDLLGVKYIYVPGYRGGPKVRPAVRRGELNFRADSVAGYAVNIAPTMEKKGLVKTLWSWSPLDSKGNMPINRAVSKLPTFLQVYKDVHGKKPSGLAWEALKLTLNNTAVTTMTLGPPAMNAEATAALRKGFKAMLKDEAYTRESLKSFTYVNIAVPLAMARKRLTGLSRLDPKLVAFLKDHVAKGGKGRKKGRRKKK